MRPASERLAGGRVPLGRPPVEPELSRRGWRPTRGNAGVRAVSSSSPKLRGVPPAVGLELNSRAITATSTLVHTAGPRITPRGDCTFRGHSLHLALNARVGDVRKSDRPAARKRLRAERPGSIPDHSSRCHIVARTRGQALPAIVPTPWSFERATIRAPDRPRAPISTNCHRSRTVAQGVSRRTP
jgi:hypothetical protein